MSYFSGTQQEYEAIQTLAFYMKECYKSYKEKQSKDYGIGFLEQIRFDMYWGKVGGIAIGVGLIDRRLGSRLHGISMRFFDFINKKGRTK